MAETVLGINAFHGDSAAALLVDGMFTCGIEEERLNRVKHWAGFPKLAIEAVLRNGGKAMGEIEHVAMSRDPRANLLRKVLFSLRNRPGLETITSRLENHKRIKGVGALLASVGDGTGQFRGTVHSVEHHRAHLASAFFCSPFDEAACLTVDGFGDFVSSMSALGRGSSLRMIDQVMFPHSVGIFYTAITQYLGFPKYGDEYKVMGLASYGRPEFLPHMRRLVKLAPEGKFELDLDFFVHSSEGVTMSWQGGEPTMGPLFSPKLVDLLGPAREPGSEISERHQNIAASMQSMYEEVFFHRLRWLRKKSGSSAICLAGGCALNSVANGKIFDQTDFRDVYIQPAAGDAGTALGAALWVWHQVLAKPRSFVMEHSYFGEEFSENVIVEAIERTLPAVESSGDDHLRVWRIADEAELCRDTAGAIAEGKVVGWFQGRTEWGPRALGNRSIVVDPRRAEMKDVLNSRIKRREPFRPYAPSILEERTGDYFENSYPDPFMIKVYPVRPARRTEIPAVTHVDGTGRLQTVSRRQNRKYWELIRAFEERTGVPVVLNTSFNENEPIVNTPTEALDCFLRTRMDRLVMGHWVIERPQ